MNTKNTTITFEDVINEIKIYIKEDKDIEEIEKGYLFAKKIHEGEKRLNGQNMIDHLLCVVHILASIKADKETIIAGFLHDSINNQKTTLEEIENNFGKEVEYLVSGISKINKLKYNGTTEATIANYRKILVGMTEDVRVILIKLADRLHNMRTVYALSKEKQKVNAEETLEVLAPIAHHLGINTIKSELEELSLRYLKPDVYFSIVEQLNKSKNERNAYVNEMMGSVSNLLKDNNIKFEIKGRAKSIYSIYKKLDSGKPFSDIYDLLALRIYVDKVSDCYQVLGLIHSKYKPVPKRLKDYIAMPKSNMYQSLHTTVFGKDNNYFEIQIRTYEMNEIAENGIASHWSYKEKGKSLMRGMEEKLDFFRSIIDINGNDEEIAKNMAKELQNTIYVYTPKGDVIELPFGSTPIDFAYRVHSKVGDTMVGAIVNDNIVSLDYKLQDNDVIKINTNNNSNGPSKSWIDMCYTSQAKNKIRSFFNKMDKEEYAKIGEELLAKELRKKKITNSFLEEDNLSKVLKELHLNTKEEMYINIGSNKITPIQVINCLNKENRTKEQILLDGMNNKEQETNKTDDIIVQGIDDIKVNIAKCCNPIPGDAIVGYIQTGVGINIHKLSCPNVSSLEEKLIDVSWNHTISKNYTTDIIIFTNSTKDILLDLVSKTANSNVTIKRINTVKDNNVYNFEVKVSVSNCDNLSKFMNDVKSIEEVTGVERVIK